MKRGEIIFCLLFCGCILLIFSFNKLAAIPEDEISVTNVTPVVSLPHTINKISLPEGYVRMNMPVNSFGHWLQQVALRSDNTVYLYNGQPKNNQREQYAVLDFPTGTKDLQQCADAIMRLQAEYFFSRKNYKKINFWSADTQYNFQQYLDAYKGADTDLHTLLLKFMETVFMHCGTYTISAMTKNIPLKNVQPGDVFVKAGAPGHAMIVADVAVHSVTGNKIFLLVQSFMPAQDMHIVINPASAEMSPWYMVHDSGSIITPGWTFEPNELKRW